MSKISLENILKSIRSLGHPIKWHVYVGCIVYNFFVVIVRLVVALMLADLNKKYENDPAEHFRVL